MKFKKIIEINEPSRQKYGVISMCTLADGQQIKISIDCSRYFGAIVMAF